MNFNNTSDVLSAIAIIVSICSAGYQWYLDSHMNRVNLEAEYFRELYMESLLYCLPESRKYIRFHEKKLVDIDKMLKELNAIRQKSLYFLYSDPDFYNCVKSTTQDLEDYLIQTSQKIIESEDEKDVLQTIQNKIETIYKTLNRKYIGK